METSRMSKEKRIEATAECSEGNWLHPTLGFYLAFFRERYPIGEMKKIVMFG